MFKNFVSKVMTFIFCVTMLLVPKVNVSAATTLAPGKDDIVQKTVTKINEYDAYKHYISLSDAELLESGFSKDDITYLRNLDFKAELKKRANLPTSQLIELGYSDREISKLRTYDGSDNIQPYAATGLLTSNLYKASPTQFKVMFNWSWSSCPVFIRTDIIAVVWSASNSSALNMNAAIDKSQTNTYHNITYYDTYSGKYTTDKRPFDINHEYAGASSSFSLGYNYGDGYMRWAPKGGGQITINAPEGPIYELLMRFEYGHTYVTGTPSFKISGSGPSIGISFNATTKTEDFSSHRYRSNGQTVS